MQWNNLPEQFIQKIINVYGEEKAQAILSTFCEPKLPQIRINTLKITIQEAKKALENMYGVDLQNVEWMENAYIVLNKTTRELTELEIYAKGFFYIQSLSSMIPAVILDPQPEEKILDIAAAPGSKTSQLAAMMNNTGEIVANDTSRVRMYKLEENLRQQGVKNVSSRVGLGEKIWQEFPEYFDKTLVDVPCSMEGRFDCNDRKSFDHWSPKKVKQLAKQQQWLLRSAISATKPGGTIVYSTCTLSPEENEGVIDWIVQKEADCIEVEEIHIKGLQGSKPIMAWNNRVFSEKIQKTLRVTPTTIMEGFYVAKLRKMKSNVRVRFKHL